MKELREFQTAVHENACQKGFWKKQYVNPRHRLHGAATKIALMHSELSEALEADRNGNPPDDKIPAFSGLEAELADVIIRVLDFAEGYNLDVIGAMLAKAHMHGGKAY